MWKIKIYWEKGREKVLKAKNRQEYLLILKTFESFFSTLLDYGVTTPNKIPKIIIIFEPKSLEEKSKLYIENFYRKEENKVPKFDKDKINELFKKEKKETKEIIEKEEREIDEIDEMIKNNFKKHELKNILLDKFNKDELPLGIFEWEVEKIQEWIDHHHDDMKKN